MANLDHSVPVTPETVFHIASVSKNILAAVLLQLVDEGKLNLDDDVTKYVPEAPTHGRKITVRQLLNHTSGIYSFTSLPEAAANERLDLTNEQVLPPCRRCKKQSCCSAKAARLEIERSIFHQVRLNLLRESGFALSPGLRRWIPFAKQSASL
jgi:beta-lactamase family protein